MTEAHFDFPEAENHAHENKASAGPGFGRRSNIFMTRRNILLEVCAGSSAE
jgi:hypothetical protein